MSARCMKTTRSGVSTEPRAFACATRRRAAERAISKDRAFRVVSAIVVTATLAGCAANPRRHQPAVDPDALPSHVFTHYLASVPVVTVGEGARAVLLLTPTGESAKTFPERRLMLQRLGAWRASWSVGPDDVLDQGKLAYMLRVVCGMPVGVSEALLGGVGGAAERYALRTCTHEEVLPYGQPHHPVSGGMLQSALIRAESYISTDSSDSP